MTYEILRPWAAMAGLFIFIGLFIGVLIYVFWPGNKRRFERAARIPLDKDGDETSGGPDGR